MRKLVNVLAGVLVFGMLTAHVAVANAAAPSAAEAAAKEILDAAGVKGGFIVHLGSGDGKLTAALRVNDSYQVQGLDTGRANVARARKYLRSEGVYGPVTVAQLTSKRLPYVDNLVNLVVSEDPGNVPMAEVLRVLAPQGVAYLKQGDRWVKTVKPRPQNIDEWTHYLHDATGNAVAHDSVVGPPRHLQWVGSPRWSRHHDRMASMSALVSSGGRMFYIMDEGSRKSIQLPPKWTVIARDAFNGTVLWKKRIEKWHSHLWPLKSGPTQLARRLVAQGDRVYVTMGMYAPLTVLDAATGKTIRTYEQSKSTEEIILSDGTLFLLVNKGESELARYAPQLNVGDQGRVAREFLWNGKPRQVMAIDAQTGRVLWNKQYRVSPLTLTAAKDRIILHDGEKVVCLDRKSGEELWASAPAARRKNVTFNFGPKLVIYDNVVLFAGGNGKMASLAIETGEELWNAPHGPSGYQSPEDLLVVAGLVYTAPTTRTGDSGVMTGRDPVTGKVKIEFPPDVQTYWFHHRCYIAKATDKFLLTSRTGVEFVDPQTKHWDINHWVRGGCLYGVMPCNGFVYAPPHDCACYPEAKLFGFNVMAPVSDSRKVARVVPDAGRLQQGPAYGTKIAETVGAADWPTYRHDAARSGATKSKVPSELKQAWQSKLGGKLSTLVIAGGKVFVSQVDEHLVHALDADSGDVVWSYSAGGRVDSPPTIYKGRVVFGSADGYVYCLRETDGALVWRYRAAPEDRRLMAYEQLESVWPVQGSVLVDENVASFTAGRSNFLDGGLRMIRLDVRTGRKLTETVIDDRDPKTGRSLQERIQTLNMPVGLPDVLTTDGAYVYMKSQQFDLDGNRLALGPHSGQPAQQGAAQGGEGRHLFAPMGFLDDSWFHRSYWVYGRSFAGGHAGFYQAGKYTPSGRILVHNHKTVYGYGRKPQYYRWTTILEHQLFATPKDAPTAPAVARRRGGGTMIRIAKTKSIDPTGKPVAVEAWVKAERPNGVVLARGGPAHGYALFIRNGQPRFVVRADAKISSVSAKEKVVGRWVHLVGVLTADKQLELYLDGELATTAKAASFVTTDPAESMEIGADDRGAVGSYRSPLPFTGLIDEVNVFHGPLTAAQIKARFRQPKQPAPQAANQVLSLSFDRGTANDESGHENDGKLAGVRPAIGKVGSAMRFAGRAGRSSGSFVKHDWTQDTPVFVRGMVLANTTLFVAGPPDILDEEKSFEKLTDRDPKIQTVIAAQQAALDGKSGALLIAVSTTDGKQVAKYPLTSLPTWDGLAAANGRLYLSTKDGRVLCFGSP